VIRALVFDTDAPFRDEGPRAVTVPATERVAGLTLLRRSILMAWRAGAEHVTVVAQDAEARRRLSESEQRLRVPVSVVMADQGLPDVRPDDRILVLCAPVLANGEMVEWLLSSSREQERSAAAVAAEAPCIGAAVLLGTDLAHALAATQSVEAAVRQVLQSPRVTPVTVAADAYRRLDSRGAVQAAERAMFSGLTSISDGYVDRVFNRHISGWFTRRIINLPITPNQVTWFHFSLGLVAAWLFWQGQHLHQVLGAVLFQLSVALDCSDGEVARLKYQFSRFGSWLDVWADNTVTIAVFVAIVQSAHTHLGARLTWLLGGLTVSGVLMCLLVVFTMAKLQERLRPGEASSLAATNRFSSNDQGRAESEATLVDKVINEVTSRDFSVLVVAFALAGRLEWFPWLTGIGSHLFWIVFAGIQFSMLRTANAQSR